MFFVYFVLNFGKYSNLSFSAIVHCSDIIYTIANSNENVFKAKTLRANMIIIHQWIGISFTCKTWWPWTHHIVLLKVTISLTITNKLAGFFGRY